MNTSKSNNSSTNTMQIEIVPQRMLSVNTTKKLLNEIYRLGSIIRVMIQGLNLPNHVEYGPGKGELVNHPLKDSIDICGQEVNLKNTVGRIFIEVKNEEIALKIHQICKEVLPFPFEFYKGVFFKKKPTLVDYAKFGSNSDNRLWGLSDPKSNANENIKYIKFKEKE